MEETRTPPLTKDSSELWDSVIGVATTSSLPASNSRSAVIPGAYRPLESPRISPNPVPERPVSISGTRDVGRLMMSGDPEEGR